MGTILDLMVRVGADVSGFRENMNRAGESVESFVAAVDKSQAGLRAIGLAATGAGAAILGGLALATKAAAEAREEQVLLEAALKAAGESSKENIAALVDAAEALQGYTKFSDEAAKSTERFLLTTGRSVEEIKTLLPVIADFAVASGQDLGSAASQVTKAMNGQTVALRRYGIVLKDNIPPAERLTEIMRALKLASEGAAAAQAKTLGGALALLRNRVNDLLERIGEPFLAPLARIVKAMADGVGAVTRFAEANPALVRTLGFITAALGLLLFGGGGLVVMLSFLGKAIALMKATAAGAGILGAAIRALAVAASVNPLGLLLTILALLIVIIPAVIANFDALKKAFLVAATFIITLAKELVLGFLQLEKAILTLNFDLAKKSVDRMSNALDTARKASKNAAVEMDKAEESANNLAAEARRLGKEFENLKFATDIAIAQIDLFAAKSDEAAASTAKNQLSLPGLNKQQMTAAFEALETARRDTEVRRLKETSKHLAQLHELSVRVNGETAKETLDIAKRLSDAKRKLDDLEIQELHDKAKKVIAAEEDLAAQRLDTERTLIRDKTELQKTFIENASAIVQAQADFERAEADRRLEAFKLQEETRIGVLRRVIELAKNIEKTVFAAREALVNAQFKREETLQKARARERAQLVKEGFLTEAEAERKNAEERSALAIKRIQFEIEQEKKKLDSILRQRQLEKALILAEFQAKDAVLDAETEARKAQLTAEFQLMETDLEQKRALLRLETDAKIAELDLQFQAFKDEREREIEADAATAAPEITERRLAALRTAETRHNTTMRALQATRVNTETAINEQIRIARDNHNKGLAAIDEARNKQREAASIALRAALLEVETAMAGDRAGALERLADLEDRVSDEIEKQRAALREQGFIDSEIDAILKPSIDALQSIRSFQDKLEKDTTAQLGVLETAYKTLFTSLETAIQPLLDKMRELTDPTKIQAFVDALRPFLVPGAGAPTPAPVGAGGSVNQFNFSGVTMNLTADEASLLQRLIMKLMGPEGERLFNEKIRSQPQGAAARGAAAGGL